MPIATVLTLGELPELAGLDALAVDPDDNESIPLIARVCAAITRLAPAPPLVIVAEGEWAELLPGIALAQRAARRAVRAYVLLDPVLPAVSEQWPDARVHALGRPGFDLRTCELRGWDTHQVSDLTGIVSRIRAEE